MTSFSLDFNLSDSDNDNVDLEVHDQLELSSVLKLNVNDVLDERPIVLKTLYLKNFSSIDRISVRLDYLLDITLMGFTNLEDISGLGCNFNGKESMQLRNEVIAKNKQRAVKLIDCPVLKSIAPLEYVGIVKLQNCPKVNDFSPLQYAQSVELVACQGSISCLKKVKNLTLIAPCEFD